MNRYRRQARKFRIYAQWSINKDFAWVPPFGWASGVYIVESGLWKRKRMNYKSYFRPYYVWDDN